MIQHLTLRVAWHDNRWNGAVCNAPSLNSFCVALDRIREERDEVKEDALHGRHFSTLSPDEMPPCKAESGAFMNDREWTRTFKHPYQENKKAAATHGQLKETKVTVPPFATFAVPFAWMLAKSQEDIDNALPLPLSPDEKAPFHTPWVFGRERQEELTNLIFGRVTDEKSLVFFYTKEGHPLGEAIPRLVIGVGRVLKVGPLLRYETRGKNPYPLWDRVIRHSIRPDEADGFLLPYHDYLQGTGNTAEDERRLALLKEIIVPVHSPHMMEFSYAAQLAGAGAALSTLKRCLDAARAIRSHGIVKGPWDKREEWLNAQIAMVWKDRGAFPGVGSALEAVGMRLGTALFMELLASGAVKPEDDPWPVVDAVVRGKRKPPQAAYAADLKAVRATWEKLSTERRSLLFLLSRFDLSPGQVSRWFDATERARATHREIEDKDILTNPYVMAEADLGDLEDSPVSVGYVDHGLMPETTIAARHPVPKPSAIGSPIDPRRVRAAFVSILRDAADEGDSLLSTTEAIERLGKLDLARPCVVGTDWIEANKDFLQEAVKTLDILRDVEKGKKVPSLQLVEYKAMEDRLRKILRARAEQPVPKITADWSKLLVKAIESAGGKCDKKNARHVEALSEQVEALTRITTRKLAALVGRAGTGKTSVLGALLRCDSIVKDGVLLLAPTGKARVRLGKVTGAEAMTIAQFLYRLDRYDGIRQTPLLTGTEKYRKEKTVVIDECSMLTMDSLLAVMEALDLAHVQRLILVGDPNQLPPIGVGRPFADFTSSLELACKSPDKKLQDSGKSIARLGVEVRATAGAPSDTLRLASWFTREPQPVDADRVLSDLELGQSFNDLEICFWRTPAELRGLLLKQFQKQLGVKNEGDVDGFNRALGFSEEGWVPFDQPDGVENFQILSPVRMHPHGVHELNRWIQGTFRRKQLEASREPWGMSLGDEEIVVTDKVIQLRNKKRQAFDGKAKVDVYLANGEIGTVCSKNAKFLNVLFAGRPGLTIGYGGWDFPDGGGPLELAYALTVHKSQGSEFRKVFVILPKNCRLISRELLYTALTRSRDLLVLLVEGSDASFLYDLTRPERSVTAGRNTNLFEGVVRERTDEVPYAEHLIHRTEKGHMVRSKSELVIANMLYRMGVDYEYERVADGSVVPGRLRPDFSFIDPAGNLILWEHLGLLIRDDYRKAWEWKKEWYRKNGFELGKNVFTTEESEKGGLDSTAIKRVAEAIRELIS